MESNKEPNQEPNQDVNQVEEFEYIIPKEELVILISNFVKNQEKIIEEEKKILLLNKLYKFINQIICCILTSIKHHPNKMTVLLFHPKNISEESIINTIQHYIEPTLINLKFITHSDGMNSININWLDNNAVILSILEKNKFN